MSVIIVE